MMKRMLPFLALTFLLSSFLLQAQTNHNVDVQSNFYTPDQLTITEGDTVTWMNLGGFHNVNGSQATYPDNPEGFSNGGASGASWTYQFVFNTPGTYTYQCDPHVGFGMIGTITVEPATVGGATQMLLTGVYDGPLTGGLPKGIELYVLEDIADLSIYGIGSATNGGGSDGVEYTFPAESATAGSYLYLTTDEQGFADFFGFTPDYVDDMGTAVSINGDDAIELFLNDEVVDVFGEIDVDGTGQPWEYLDGWAYRVNGTGPDGTTFVLSNWIFSGINVFDGETSNNTAAVPFPNGTYTPDGSGMLAANNDVASTDINQAVTIDVLGNDFLPNPVTMLTAMDGTNGSTTVNPDNTITYTPDTDYCGDDSFTYEVCDADGCQMATVEVMIACPIDYPVYTIAEVTTTDSEGALDSIDVFAQLSGIVYGVNLRPDGLQFTLIDGNNVGIGVFSGNNNFGYTVQERDEVIVQGRLDQFNGFAQISADTVWMVSADNALFAPQIVDELGEDTESQLVTIQNVSLVDPAQWDAGGSGFNVEVTDGVNTTTVRIDNDVDLFNLPAPTGTFNVTGIGGQFDSSSPFDEGYQLLPRYMEDIDPYVPAAGPEYISYPVGTVTTIDADGVADSIGTAAELQGIVYGVNLRGNGLQFTLIDELGDGIGVLNNSDNFGYTVQEGDELLIKGTIDQFNGLIQILPDSLELLSSGNTLLDSDIVTSLDETTESQLVTLEGLTLLDPGQWADDGSSFNIEATDGTNTYTIRVDNNTTLAGTAGPGTNDFNLTGIGGQFDPESPFDEGYQILPRYLEDLDVLGSTVNPALENKILISPNPASSLITIEMEEQIDAIRVANALGQELRVIHRPGSVQYLDLGLFESGIYFFTFITQKGIWTEEVIKL